MTMEGPGNKKELKYEWSLPTDIERLDEAEQILTEKLVKAGWDEESAEVEEIQTGFKEALVNAIAHGHLKVTKKNGEGKSIYILSQEEQKRNPSDKKIHVTFEANEKRVSIKVRDEGAGFDHEKVSDPTHPENILKESGRGIFFMKKMYFDSVTYNREGNEVTLVKERKS